jgi:dienelactone hydrolase
VTTWGSAGSANGQFNRPAGVAVDSAGHVYVVDQDNNRVQKFSNTGTFVTAWGSAGNGTGQFRRPTGIAVDAAGQVYVTDCDNDRIQKFDATGTFLAQWGMTGNEAGEFRGPTDIAFDSAGNAYVTDAGPEFTIGAGLEGVANEIVVNLDALVRYPADNNGAGVPMSTTQERYPLVILAHGRHSSFEFRRDAMGAPILIAGAPDPIVDAVGNVVEFKNQEGLEYLATHLASHGFIAVSINLNGRFHPSTDWHNVTAELVEPQGNVVTCRPAVLDQVGIAHRGLTVLRHIQEMQRRNSTDAIFQGKIDVDRIAIIGHSRGGEAVVSAYDINRGLPMADRASIKAVMSIAPTDFRHLSLDIPYLVVLGSDDEDVIDGGGLRLYDRAVPPRRMVWVIGAIHNFFSSNWHWQDEVSAAPPVTRPQHEYIARGYSNVFLQQVLGGNIEGLNAYFTGTRRLNSLPASVELHFALQTPGGFVVDHFEDAPPNKANNTLGQSVTGTALLSFDELVFHRHTPAAPVAITVMAQVLDILATRLTLSGCTVNLASWFHETNAMMIAWDSTSAVYASALPNSSVMNFDVLSFRVAQDITGNPAGGQQDFQVTLIDSAGARASLRVSGFTTIPFPRTKQLTINFPAPIGPRLVDFTKSVFKTVRLPLDRFKQANTQLNLGSLASIAFEFSVNIPGRLGLDDIEFSR